jgi:hypothetical protein
VPTNVSAHTLWRPAGIRSSRNNNDVVPASIRVFVDADDALFINGTVPSALFFDILLPKSVNIFDMMRSIVSYPYLLFKLSL